MRNILLISQYTLREAISRKIFIWFLAISTLILIGFILLFSSVGLDSLTGFADKNVMDEAKLLETTAGVFKVFIVGYLYFIGFILSIFSSSGFIPSMLEKGNIDLLLSKPVSRAQLLFGKFSGGLLVVLINIFYLIFGIWLLIGLKFNVWDLDFLLTIPTITYTFGVLYSFIILIGVLTGSSILAMMLTFLIFFIFSPLLTLRDQLYLIVDNKTLELVLDTIYYVVPQTSELQIVTADLALGGSISSYDPIFTSLAFMILSIALGIIIFNKKDY